MTVCYALLGFLEESPRHGYELKRQYDARFAWARPLQFAQVYSTLGRLERDGLVVVAAVEPGEGPDRRRYAITAEGVRNLEDWLAEPETPVPHIQSVLFTKVALAVLSDRPAERFLDAQRAAHLQRMRELTDMKRSGSLSETLVADYALFHLEADLRWIDLAGARLARLGQEAKR